MLWPIFATYLNLFPQTPKISVEGKSYVANNI